MTGPALDDGLLNAYVDGQLGAGEAARISRLAAADPAVAARIATLHQLKAAVAALADDVVMLDAPRPAAPNARVHRGWHAASALAAALIVAAVALWLLVPPAGAPGQRAQIDVVDPVVSGHDAWSASFDRTAEAPVAPEWLEGLMQATGLRLVHAAPARIEGGGEMMHFAFVGANNCRLSLFERPLPGEPDIALGLSFDDRLMTARWQRHGFAYTMVARDMDRTRFTTIAAAVHDVTHNRAPADETLLVSLRAARQRCVT